MVASRPRDRQAPIGEFYGVFPNAPGREKQRQMETGIGFSGPVALRLGPMQRGPCELESFFEVAEARAGPAAHASGHSRFPMLTETFEGRYIVQHQGGSAHQIPQAIDRAAANVGFSQRQQLIVLAHAGNFSAALQRS